MAPSTRAQCEFTSGYCTTNACEVEILETCIGAVISKTIHVSTPGKVDVCACLSNLQNDMWKRIRFS